MNDNPIYTIGHSTRSLDEFLSLLKAYRIQTVLDVRTIPRSHHNSQFNKEGLKESLNNNGIGYQHLESLGGLRHARKNSENLGWKNLSFRGYADHMETPEFSRGLSELEEIARKKIVAIMCAEAVPWRCHRSLIADALQARKFEVIHILDDRSSYVHKPTSFLRIRDGRIFYPEVIERKKT